jgi:hypothetical protein
MTLPDLYRRHRRDPIPVDARVNFAVLVLGAGATLPQLAAALLPMLDDDEHRQAIDCLITEGLMTPDLYFSLAATLEAGRG